MKCSCMCNKIYELLSRKFYNILKKITNRKMIIDITGVLLTPGNYGKDCRGNGEHFNHNGEQIECCCDECDYMMCCFKEYISDECSLCNNANYTHTKE